MRIFFDLVLLTDILELAPLLEQLDFAGVVCGIGGKKSRGWGRFEIAS